MEPAAGAALLWSHGLGTLGVSVHVQLSPDAFLQSQKEGGMILWCPTPSQAMPMYATQHRYQCEIANTSIWLYSSCFLDA